MNIKILSFLVKKILQKTSNLTFSGFDNIKKNIPYLFISNHRDIVLDSAILQILLIDNGFPTTEIGIGDNLISSGFPEYLTNLLKLFIIPRQPVRNEKIMAYKKLSTHIREGITLRKNSIWIAQKNGRTMDGNDKTSPGLLKMLYMSNQSDFIESFNELNIVPVSISYEYEPCDYLKVWETSLHGNFNTFDLYEDLDSIITGLIEQKGNIHLSIGKCLNLKELEELKELKTNKQRFTQLAEIIDKQIYDNYKLWNTNFIAHYILMHSTPSRDIFKYISFFNQKEKQNFIKYMDKRLEKLKGDKKLLKQIFLNIYAYPFFNKTMPF